MGTGGSGNRTTEKRRAFRRHFLPQAVSPLCAKSEWVGPGISKLFLSLVSGCFRAGWEAARE